MGFEITISPLLKDDIQAIMEIELRSQVEPWSERSFLEELGRLHSHLLVARMATADEGKSRQAPTGFVIAGYICYWCVADEIQILNIAVGKEFRRRGVARALLSNAIDTGREQKADAATLEVRKSNFAARRLYESFGFRTVGERPNYYGVQTEPAILMELDISRKDG